MSEDVARRFAEATNNPSFGMIGLLVGWKVFGYLFSPIFSHALRLLYLGVSS